MQLTRLRAITELVAMSILKEFKEFALKGSVIDLAVGLIVGAAFNAIVTSVVNDLVMPILGSITQGSLELSNHYLPLSSKVPSGVSLKVARETGGAVLAWGNFVTVSINFVIVSACIFLVIKAINRFRRKQEVAAVPAEPALTRQEVLLTEIRDLLKK